MKFSKACASYVKDLSREVAKDKIDFLVFLTNQTENQNASDLKYEFFQAVLNKIQNDEELSLEQMSDLTDMMNAYTEFSLVHKGSVSDVMKNTINEMQKGNGVKNLKTYDVEDERTQLYAAYIRRGTAAMKHSFERALQNQMTAKEMSNAYLSYTAFLYRKNRELKTNYFDLKFFSSDIFENLTNYTPETKATFNEGISGTFDELYDKNQDAIYGRAGTHPIEEGTLVVGDSAENAVNQGYHSESATHATTLYGIKGVETAEWNVIDGLSTIDEKLKLQRLVELKDIEKEKELTQQEKTEMADLQKGYAPESLELFLILNADNKLPKEIGAAIKEFLETLKHYVSLDQTYLKALKDNAKKAREYYAIDYMSKPAYEKVIAPHLEEFRADLVNLPKETANKNDEKDEQKESVYEPEVIKEEKTEAEEEVLSGVKIEGVVPMEQEIHTEKTPLVDFRQAREEKRPLAQIGYGENAVLVLSAANDKAMHVFTEAAALEETKILTNCKNLLHNVRTTRNSPQYDHLEAAFDTAITALNTQVTSDGKAVKNDIAYLKALLNVKTAIVKYYEHKAKDGVRNSVVRKLAAVEQVSRFVNARLYDLGKTNPVDYDKVHGYKPDDDSTFKNFGSDEMRKKYLDSLNTDLTMQMSKNHQRQLEQLADGYDRDLGSAYAKIVNIGKTLHLEMHSSLRSHAAKQPEEHENPAMQL